MANRETDMVHYECGVCLATATCVQTPAADLAWLDHMANHADPYCYGRWTWTVLPLKLDQGDR